MLRSGRAFAKIKDTPNSDPLSPLQRRQDRRDCPRRFRGSRLQHVTAQWGPIYCSSRGSELVTSRDTEYNRKTKLRLLIRDATLNGVFREFMAGGISSSK